MDFGKRRIGALIAVLFILFIGTPPAGLSAAKEQESDDKTHNAAKYALYAKYYEDHEKYESAIYYYKQLLDEDKVTFGPNSAKVALALSKIAFCYCKEQKFALAEPPCQQALAILKGKTSVHDGFGGTVKRALNNCAAVMYLTNRVTQAKQLEQLSASIVAKDDYTQRTRVVSLIETCVGFAKQGRFNDMLPLMDQAVNLQPEWYLTYLLRSIVLLALEQEDRAVTDLNTALALEPGNMLCYLVRGVAFVEMNQNQKALDDWNRLIKLAPCAPAYVLRGDLYAKLKQPKKALDDVNRAIVLDQTERFAYIIRACLYDMTGERDKALKDLTQASRLDEKSDLTFILRAFMFLESGERDRAMESFNQAILLCPKHSFAYFSRAEAYDLNGDYVHALEDLTQAINLSPHSSRAYDRRAIVHAHDGNTQEALKDLDQAVKLNPYNAEALKDRGVLLEQLGQHERALADLDAAIKADPDHAETYKQRGILLGHLGERDKANADFDRYSSLYNKKLESDLFAKSGRMELDDEEKHRGPKGKLARSDGKEAGAHTESHVSATGSAAAAEGTATQPSTPAEPEPKDSVKSKPAVEPTSRQEMTAAEKLAAIMRVSPSSRAEERPSKATDRRTNSLAKAPQIAGFDAERYLAQLEKQIRAHSSPLSQASNGPIAVRFKINRGGEPEEFELLATGNGNDFNLLKRDVQNIIERTAPFHPLPVTGPASITIEVTFDSKLEGGLSASY